MSYCRYLVYPICRTAKCDGDNNEEYCVQIKCSGYRWEESSMVTVTATLRKPCTHPNGWYGQVPFLGFERSIFACSDCGEILYGKKLREFKKKR